MFAASALDNGPVQFTVLDTGRLKTRGQDTRNKTAIPKPQRSTIATSILTIRKERKSIRASAFVVYCYITNRHKLGS